MIKELLLKKLNSVGALNWERSILKFYDKVIS